MLEIKNTLIEIRNDFGISKESISNSKHVNRNFPNLKSERKIIKRKTEHSIQEQWDNSKRCNIWKIRIPEEEEKGNGEEKYICSTNDSELSKINHRHQTENTKTKTNQQINQTNKQTRPRNIIFKLK